MKRKEMSVQKWLPFEEILNNGIIKIKEEKYVKIIKVKPINYNLKTDLEKQAILNSYKTFLKTCNFDIQIIIQSNKEDLSKIISKIKQVNKYEKDKNIKYISDCYINYIKNINKEKKSSSKNLYIIIKNKKEISEMMNNNKEEIIQDELEENYFKIKECLARCGNKVEECTKEEIHKILFSFFNSRQYFSQI